MQISAALFVCLLAGTPSLSPLSSVQRASPDARADQQAQSSGDQRSEAERLAKIGANAEALKRFQAIVAANPDDVEARMWIGQLHLRMGHPVRAAGVFESIVAAQAQNVDALLGLGTALMDAGRWREAGDALNRAEALAGDRIDVLAAQGRFHGAEGRSTLALAYYGKALAKESGNVEIIAAADALRASRAHRFELGYDFQKFDGVEGAMHAGTFALNLRATDTLRVFGQAQPQSFEETNEVRFGGGVEWLAHRAVLLRAGAFATASPDWLPASDWFAHATISRRRVRWTLQLRYFDFDGASLWIGGPGIAIDLTPRLVLQGEYLRGRSEFDLLDSTTSDNASIGIHAQFSERVRGSVSYHRGIDRLDWLTLDRLTADDANTMSFGLAGDVTPFVTLSGGYDFHDRSEGFQAHRARGWLTFRF